MLNRSDYDLLIKTAKSIYYPKRRYSKVFAESGLEKSKVELLQKFLEVHAIDVKRMDALAVLDYIKKIAI